MLTKLKKDALKNKQLVKNLNRKMFLGYTKLKNSLKKKRNEIYTIYDPKREYLPFEYEYHAIYKEKYLKKSKSPKLLDLSIRNYSQNTKGEEKTYLNKLLLTENPDIPRTIRAAHNKTESDLSSHRTLFKKIYENEEEKKIFSDLPFFSLNKISQNNRYNNKEEFLYKISHNNIDENNNNIKNITLYNTSKFKNKFKEKALNQNKPYKPNLKLDVKNITPIHLKIPILNTKERHLKYISNQISLLKSIPNNIIKNFNDMISNGESEDEEEYIKSKNMNDISFSINSVEETKKFNIKKINIYQKLNNEKMKTYNNFNFTPTLNKKVKKYPLNFYSLQQLSLKNKKYEEIHKEAFRNFQTKINLKKDYKKKLNYEIGNEEYRPLTLGVLEPSKNLLKSKKMTHKLGYLRESKIRDLIISKKLKCEFDNDDIIRILNGKEPFKFFKPNQKNYFHNEMIN